MNIHFVDNNFDVVKALEYVFKEFKEIDIQYGNIRKRWNKWRSVKTFRA